METRIPGWTDSRPSRLLDDAPRQLAVPSIADDGPRTNVSMAIGSLLFGLAGVALFLLKDLFPRGSGIPGYEILLGLAVVCAIGGLVLLTQVLDPRADSPRAARRPSRRTVSQPVRRTAARW